MRHFYIALCVVTVALSIPLTALAQGPFGQIRVGANRSKYAGACPVEVIFTGNINMNIPHPQGFAFNYYWVRSDGAKGPVNVVRPPAGQRMLIVKDPWTLGAQGKHYDLSVTLFVNSGNTHLQQASQVVSISCR
jgi:hypothetical protein